MEQAAASGRSSHPEADATATAADPGRAGVPQDDAPQGARPRVDSPDAWDDDRWARVWH